MGIMLRSNMVTVEGLHQGEASLVDDRRKKEEPREMIQEPDVWRAKNAD